MPPQLLLGDCLQLFKDIKDETIDLVLTDCPYKIIAGGVTIKEGLDETSGILRKRAISDGSNCSNKWLKKGEDGIPSAVKAGKMFAHNDIKFSEWLPEVFRVLKKGTHCYIMINSRNLKDLQVEAEKVGFEFQNLLVWHKNNATPNKYYMQNAEFILMLSKRPAKNINDMGSKTVISIPNIIGNKVHPSEKPVSLLEILIRNSTQEGETVLDPFMGGGSTGLASINLNRNFIGFEIDEEYYKVAIQRIDQIGGNAHTLKYALTRIVFLVRIKISFFTHILLIMSNAKRTTIKSSFLFSDGKFQVYLVINYQKKTFTLKRSGYNSSNNETSFIFKDTKNDTRGLLQLMVEAQEFALVEIGKVNGTGYFSSNKIINKELENFRPSSF